MSEATPDLATLRALEARLVAATELETDLILMLDTATAVFPSWKIDTYFVSRFWRLLNAGACLDAAMALTGRVLPGWDWTLHHTNGGLTIYAQVGPREPSYASHSALALCLALVRAVIEQKENNDAG